MLYDNIVGYAFFTWAGIQLIIAIFVFSRIYWLPRSKPTITYEKKPVSVIICARNEAQHLPQYLPPILQQNYHSATGAPLFEVVVVDDHSTDDTATVLYTLQQQWPHLRVVQPSDAQGLLKGKKRAQAAGVMAARYELLLFTDADCQVAGRDWLAHMVAPLHAGKAIAAGYGGYIPVKGALNLFTRWETVHSYLQWSTLAMAGRPYMAVGRNIACTRSVYHLASASPYWNAAASGDDDMLIRACGTADNYALVTTPESFTWTTSEQDLANWTLQKQRHLSTGKHYHPLVRLVLGTYGFTHAGVWFYFPFAMFTPWNTVVLPVMLVRCLLYWCLMGYTAGRLRDKKLLAALPACDFAWMLYNFTFLPYIAWKSKQHWR
ncbi:MAG: glycosyltransferase [Chitinophagia bacterium]|nr:glycosyltransferase [Chitinophagia bacterium]